MSDEKRVPETLETIAEKVTGLSASTEARFADLSTSIDARFTDLSASIDARFTGLSASTKARFTDLSASTEARFTDLSTSIDARFTLVDRKFDEVTEALVEQRQYTEFAFEKLRVEIVGEMTGGFGRLDRKLDRVLDALPKTPSPRRRRRS